MNEVSLIINVSDVEHHHDNGQTGHWVIPAKTAEEEFGLLVVYPTPEIQDIGDQKTTLHWPRVHSLAHAIVGLRRNIQEDGTDGKPGVSDGGSKEKWGVLLCHAQPDIPKSLLQAMETEVNYLNSHPPKINMEHDVPTGVLGAVNVESPAVFERKAMNSVAVQEERAKFAAQCRKLITKEEVALAKKNLLTEAQRLVVQADGFWPQPALHRNIGTHHQRAANLLNQERPWCYQPLQLEDCSGCGGKIKENILICPHQGCLLPYDRATLMAMPKAERFAVMYPSLAQDVEPAKPRKTKAVTT